MYENYPRTDEEALAGYELDKRIAPDWLRQCLDIRDTIPCDISVPGFRCYELPRQERKYVIGADPAEGVERGDASCAVVLDEDGSEVGFLTGRIEPTVFAGYIAEIGKFYNNAGIIIERNNHGHAVISVGYPTVAVKPNCIDARPTLSVTRKVLSVHTVRTDS